MEFCIVKTNIVSVVADAIVLPANTLLKEGSGSSEAIFKAAGRKKLAEECKYTIGKVGKVEVGDAILTAGYDLHARYIVHAVVPKWIDGESKEYELLSAAYLSALNVADLMKCESIAFPLLASGNNGFDLEIALEIAKQSIESFEGNSLKRIILVIYGENVASIVREQGYQYAEIVDTVEKAHKKGTANNKKASEFVAKDLAVKAFDYLKEPENRKKAIAAGEAIAALAIAIAKKNGKGALAAAKKI